MPNNIRTSPFPATQQDISRLRQTATDAASDLGRTATEHVSRATGQIKELAGHFQEEGREQMDRVKGKLSDLLISARDFASDHPLACIGTALAVGFFLGLRHGRSSR